MHAFQQLMKLVLLVVLFAAVALAQKADNAGKVPTLSDAKMSKFQKGLFLARVFVLSVSLLACTWASRTTMFSSIAYSSSSVYFFFCHFYAFAACSFVVVSRNDEGLYVGKSVLAPESIVDCARFCFFV